MVLCFLIHTLCPVAGLPPGGSRVLFSRVFGPEDAALDGPGPELGPEERRLLQKEKLAVVARQVRSACALQREATGRPVVEAVQGEELAALQEAEGGVLRLGAGDPFPGGGCVLWLAVQAVGFALVCHPHENLLLGESCLRGLARICLENLRMLAPGNEVVLKSDRIEAALHRLLPHGQLLFLNHRFAQILDKDLAAYMAK
ncbi:AP-5 complex subunit sigma-1 [Anguilla anguilla]|uniref:AP-5 complex subunit sigma-1 n=1 Tax=Anguilla anguilla TaxID=7936 RepID=UPI0015AD4583|nr:AP-5 complex subunit sigma-1 [Anguilla anguilla]XP_035273732.1 AP-5 complex subunit sigma-1 [Anguilla anguilla]XP_035273733.1 AP-5 complex subunit sigma-1 [Anguilla anguilla]XP_035273734.1 AP-5 complex subunit sigma-1 [Anguilla anguilla]XP_035273735.1 AP-5 complex subunit sigma-1 [Anguilla anguilla]